AILEFLKEKGIASEEELQRHLEQAGNASSVRWRAVRVRIEYLLSSALKAAERDAQVEKKTTESRQEPSPNKEKGRGKAPRSTATKEDEQRDTEDKHPSERTGAPNRKGETQPTDKNADKNGREINDKENKNKEDKSKDKNKDNVRGEGGLARQNDREDAA
ncbi:MAG: hypothetical protein WB566_06425, partial [Terriglobales bacterium]